MWMNRGIVRLTLQISGLPVSLAPTTLRLLLAFLWEKGSGKVFGSCSAAFPGFLRNTSLIVTAGVCAECEREQRNWWGLNPCSRCVCLCMCVTESCARTKLVLRKSHPLRQRQKLPIAQRKEAKRGGNDGRESSRDLEIGIQAWSATLGCGSCLLVLLEMSGKGCISLIWASAELCIMSPLVTRGCSCAWNLLLWLRNGYL